MPAYGKGGDGVTSPYRSPDTTPQPRMASGRKQGKGSHLDELSALNVVSRADYATFRVGSSGKVQSISIRACGATWRAAWVTASSKPGRHRSKPAIRTGVSSV